MRGGATSSAGRGVSPNFLNFSTVRPDEFPTLTTTGANSTEGIAITPNSKTAYVSVSTFGHAPYVVPIRTATNTAGKPIRNVGSFAIAITPNGKTAYAPGPSNTVIPIDTATSKAGKAIKVGRTPDAIAITPSGKTAYVVLYSSGRSTVIPISTATGKAGQAIKVGSDPQAIAITP